MRESTKQNIMRILLSIIFVLITHGAMEAQNLIVHSQSSDDKENFTLQVNNRFPCSISLIVESAKLDTTFQTYIPKGNERTLLNWQNPPEELMEDPTEMFEFSFILGNPDAVHDDRYRYNLPFPAGEAYLLAQGNKTEHTHNEIISEYAFDFAMPVGSLIAAARGGVVGHVVEKYSAGGDNIHLKDRSNRVMICHDDGTVATYAHLKKDGALVEIGDRVYAGQVIGFSGSTGYSTFPHLHFVVLKGRQSIPIHFRNQYTILYEGQIYKHEDKP